MFVVGIRFLGPGQFLDCPCGRPFLIVSVERFTPIDKDGHCGLEQIVEIRGVSGCSSRTEMTLDILESHGHHDVHFPCIGRCKEAIKGPE